MWQRIAKFFMKPPALSPHIKIREHPTVGLITIDRQAALNAIDGDMYRTLYYVIRQLEKTKSHLIINGAGKTFCAGGDVKDVCAGPFCKTTEIFRNSCRSFHLISSLKKPYIAIMDGLTLGGASTYAISGKYRIATERTIYAMPETAIGFFNDAGASYFLSRLAFNVGIYLGLTGTRLKAYDVKKVGLATHFVESERLEDLETALIACKNDEEIGKALAKFSSVPSSVDTQLDANIPRIDKCFDGLKIEEIYENLHLDGSEWAMDTIRVLNTMSPMSLKVSHRSITRGKTMSLEDCMKMEYRLAIHHIINSDFKEGCRAILIDKDNKPQWNPKTLAEVTEAHLERFFGPLPNGDELTYERR